MKVIFFGTPQIAADILAYLLKNQVPVVAVVTKPDRPQGRSKTPVPSPVKLLAQNHSIPVHQPEKASTPEFADLLQTYQADLFAVVAYGEIINQRLLDMPPRGCINVHASLLPKYRGAAPIERCLMDGNKVTGVTIMHMVRKMDAGDIIKTGRIPVDENMTAGELKQKMSEVGSKLLLEVIQDLEKGVSTRTPQDESLVTYANKVELVDGEIHWTLPAEKIHNLVRAMNPEPGAWCYVNFRGEKKRLKILRTLRLQQLSGSPSAILSFGKQGFVVACGNEAIQILELQLEGKKALSAEEFTRGLAAEQLSFF